MSEGDYWVMARRWAAIFGAVIFLAAAAVVAAGSLQFAYDAGAALTDSGAKLSGSWLMVAVDAVKICSIAALPFLLSRKKKGIAWACIVVGTIFSLFGAYRAQVVAYAKADAVESKLKTDTETLDKDIADVERRLVLPEYVNVPTQEVVHQQMARYKINPKFSASNGCTMVPSPKGSVKFCEEYAALFSKVAAAGEADRLREKLGELRGKKVRHEAVSTANAEVKTIAEALGVGMSTAYVIRSGGFALGLEIVSGMALSVAIECFLLALGGARMRRATEGTASPEVSATVSVGALPVGSPVTPRDGAESTSPEGPKEPPNGGGKKPIRRSRSSPSVTPVKAGVPEGARLRLVKPSGTPCGALSVRPSVEGSPAPSGTESVSAFVAALPFDGDRERSYAELATEYTLWCQERGIVPILVTSSSKLGPAFEVEGFEKIKNSAGNMVYRDRRRAVAETA